MVDEKQNAAPPALERHRNYLRILAELHFRPALRRRLDPSDIVQLTLLRAVEGLGQFRGKTDAELLAWLRQILARTLANLARDHGRARRDIGIERSLEQSLEHSSARLDAWLASKHSSPSHRAKRNEQSARLVQALASLPVAQREALLLKHCQGWSLAEIGRHLGRTPTAVASLIQRGLHRLRDHLRTLE
jgi:RNA polymerase sigma-70 factor, ECF subfamily